MTERLQRLDPEMKMLRLIGRCAADAFVRRADAVSQETLTAAFLAIETAIIETFGPSKLTLPDLATATEASTLAMAERLGEIIRAARLGYGGRA